MQYSSRFPEDATISALLASFACLVGLSAALVARAQLEHASHRTVARVPTWRSPHLLGVLLYELLAVSPLAIYLFLQEPAWSSLYLFEGAEPSWIVGLGLGLAPVLLAGLGFGLGAWLQRGGNILPVRVALVSLSVGLLTLLALFGPRLLHVTRVGAWQSAAGPSGHLLGVLAFALPILLAGWIFLLLLFYIEGRKLERMLAFQRETHTALAASAQAPIAPADPVGGSPGF